MLTQAVLVSIVCSAFLFMPSINASYWLLTALTTQLYMLMYVILFLCGFRLRNKMNYAKGAFVIPGKKFGSWLVCALGLTGCTITLLVGFIPPGHIDIGSKLNYAILFCSGMAAMIIPISFFYWYQKKTFIELESESLADVKEPA